MQAKTRVFPVQFRVELRGEHSAISSQEQMVEPFALPCYWSIFLFHGRNTNLVPSQIPECTCSSAFTFCSHWTSLHLITPAFTVMHMGDIFRQAISLNKLCNLAYVKNVSPTDFFRGSRKGEAGVGWGVLIPFPSKLFFFQILYLHKSHNSPLLPP